MAILKFLVLWTLVSVPASLLIAAIIKVGRGPEWREKENLI
jgi:hypothetical protein